MTIKNQRVGIFVDVQNLYHASKNLYKSRVNYAVLLRALTRDRQLIRSLAYVVKSDILGDHRSDKTRPMPNVSAHSNVEVKSGSSEAAFFDALKEAGLELRVKDIQIYASGEKKADWDIGMAVDSIRMASNLDVIILVTGDGDFIPLVQYLQSGLGKFVEVAAFKATTSGKLQEIADVFIDLRSIPKILIKK